ncbi:uncharacterized protein LOC115341272 [Aquila chrysaetos chrysaetos]|uniref:uncharacterized protein LOC115341272 n=1 Tax=Aquila chrysaetos chrysaetos TaxID=223781 RepID=UPI001B7D45C4|nr:uncharacterized protein LOC115341272 [Aquila chrysaetos chrysaetos]
MPRYARPAPAPPCRPRGCGSSRGVPAGGGCPAEAGGHRGDVRLRRERSFCRLSPQGPAAAGGVPHSLASVAGCATVLPGRSWQPPGQEACQASGRSAAAFPEQSRPVGSPASFPRLGERRTSSKAGKEVNKGSDELVKRRKEVSESAAVEETVKRRRVEVGAEASCPQSGMGRTGAKCVRHTSKAKQGFETGHLWDLTLNKEQELVRLRVRCRY